MRTSVALFAVAAVIVTAHSRSVEGPFVWDDRPLIALDPGVHEVRTRDYFLNAFWHATPDDEANPVYYRPVTTLSTALDWKAWSGRPSGFHLTNIALHLTVAMLVFALAHRWGASTRAAALAAALFGVLPRLTESVSWISGRTDVLASLFALGALLLHRTGRDDHLHRAGAAFLLLAGLLSKEVALAGAVAIVVLEWRRAGDIRAMLGRWHHLAPTVLALATYFALRWHALHGIPAPRLGAYPTGMARLVTIVEALGSYALMLLDPLRPRTQIGLLFHPSRVAITAGLLSLGLLVAIGYRWSRRPPSPEVTAALSLAAAGLGLVVHVVPLRIQVVAADRFLYLPAAGLAIAAAVALPPLLSGPIHRLAAAAALAAIPALAVATYARSIDWTDEVRLWERAIATSPRENALPLTQYAHALRRVGRLEEGIVALDDIAARATGTTRIAAAENAATAVADLGRLDEAAERMRALMAWAPPTALEHYNLGLIEAKRLRLEIALEEIETALALLPAYPEALRAREVISSVQRRWNALPPPVADESYEVRAARARIYAALGAHVSAAKAWGEVAAAPAASREALTEAAEYLSVYGELRDARVAVERARAAGARPDLIAAVESRVASRGARGNPQ